jgi:TonB-linked SusC/RagA family outer membrane protein
MNFITWAGSKCTTYISEHFICIGLERRASKKKIIMRINLTLALLIAALLQIAIAAEGQKVTFSKENASLAEVLKEIHQQTGYDFLYADGMMRETKAVTVNFKSVPLQKVLEICFADQPLTYTLSKKTVVIRRKPSPDVSSNEQRSAMLNESSFIVSGAVSNSNGDPLPGASVNLKGTTVGTTAGDGGKFILDVPNQNGTLVFSFVGYVPQEIPIKGHNVINVSLSEDTKSLNQIVIVGYGTQKKANLTGAVDMVTSKRLENRPIVDAGQGLEGLIPNLNVKPPNGDPTAAADFNIRGYESINGGSPLILVDGVPMSLQMINPNDIASVTVLKDAAAAAVYGARAAFGVILVETKKGKGRDKVNVQLSTELSLAKPIFLMDVVTNPYDYVMAYNTASMRTSGQPFFDDDYVQGTKKYAENPTPENAWGVYNGTLRFYGYNNYQHSLITDFAPQQKYDLTVSGASKNVNYYASFGYLNKDGYLTTSNLNFKRYNALLKTEITVNKWLGLDEKIVFNSQVDNEPHNYSDGGNLNTAARVSPIDMIQFPDLPYYLQPGDHDKYAQYIGMYFEGTNFFPYLKGGRETFTNSDLWLTQGLTLTPFKGFKLRSDFSYNTYNRIYQDVASKVDMLPTDNILTNPRTTNGFSGDDYINNQNNYNQYYVFNSYAEYTLDKFTNHYFKAMAGFNQEWGRNSFIRALARGLITPTIPDLNATSGTQQTFGGKSQVALQGIFYRVNYIFKDKYLFEANGRYDGTSRFPKDSRFGFFPSVSAGWRISKENFMAATQGWLDNLKIRASYGTLGNQLLGSDYYPYIPTMGSGMAPYVMSSGFIPYVSPAGLVSPYLTWETVVSKNLGLDVTLLKQRLDVSVDVYTRDTKNMLMNVNYPDILGTTAPKSNAADLRTKGWELSASWKDHIDKDWQYGITLALSDHSTVITKYENPNGSLNDFYVGKNIGEIWGFQTAGIFQSDADAASAPDQSQLGTNWKAGDMQYADLNKDGKITRGNNILSDHGDLTVIGNTTPRYSVGFNGDLSYKNFSFNIFFQGILHRDFLPDNGNWVSFYPFNDSHIEKYWLTETWSENNRDAYFAAPTISTQTKKNIQPQSRYVQDASYIRLKNLSLSYNLPKGLVSKVGLSQVQVYLAGMNLWEYSKIHRPLDPEISDLHQQYYLQRIFTLGAKVNF